MTDNENGAATPASVEEMQRGWHELALKVGQLEAERTALDHENKSLRFLLERVIEHRQKSHSELVLLLTGLVSKLPINDVGVVVSRLIEHNANVSQSLAAFLKGAVEADLPQPMVLRQLDETKKDLAAALKPVVDELLHVETPLESELLRSLSANPEFFFSPSMARANRCFVKGLVPRERVVRQFGEGALVFFNDMTTDPKLNPRPKPEEIVLAFKDDFESLFPQNPGLIPEKRQDLMALYHRVQHSKAPTIQARSQKNAFQRLSFLAELLHFYEHQDTEAPDALFAQRLPGLIEQLVLTGAQDTLDEKLLALAESLLRYVIRPDHRLMIVNNIGKTGTAAKTLKYVLRLRIEKPLDGDSDQVIADFAKHLIPGPPDKVPTPEALAAVLQLVPVEAQRMVVRAILHSDKLRRDEAEALGHALSKQLGLEGLLQAIKTQTGISPEIERQLAWANIAALITRNTDAVAVAAAIRGRLHAKYDADEIRQSWMILIQADPMSLIRIFSQLPYLGDGRTDPIARTVMETYVTRLTHEKYSAIYQRVVNSLRNIYAVKPDSPTLVNFMSLVRWISPEAAHKLSLDIGMAAPVH